MPKVKKEPHFSECFSSEADVIYKKIKLETETFNSICDTISPINNFNDQECEFKCNEKFSYCIENCTNYGFFGHNKHEPKYCSFHKKRKMVNLCKKTCKIHLCKNLAKFNYPKKKPLYCKRHRGSKMIQTNSKFCIIKCCNGYAKYNYKRQKPIFCINHKEHKMVNSFGKTCIEADCTVFAGFNYSHLKKPLYCKRHKKPFMVNTTIIKKCDNKHCKNKPYFYGKYGKFCFNHRVIDETLAKYNRYCAIGHCGILASYNYEGEKPIYCYKHKALKMVDVRKQVCRNLNCHKRPNFNFPGQRPIFCATHKESGMVNIRYKKSCK